jgi:hypothetical protein
MLSVYALCSSWANGPVFQEAGINTLTFRVPLDEGNRRLYGPPLRKSEDRAWDVLRDEAHRPGRSQVHWSQVYITNNLNK